MTLVASLLEADVFYYSTGSFAVWVITGDRFLVVDYAGWRPLEAVKEFVREIAATAGPHAMPGDFERATRGVRYAGRSDATSGDVHVAWFEPGDWCGLALESNDPLPQEWGQLPPGWPQEYRACIVELAARREGSSKETDS